MGVTTRSSHATQNPEENPFGADPLAAIATKLDSLDELKEKITALEFQSSRRNHGKNLWSRDSDDESEPSHRHSRLPYANIEFLEFSGGDLQGWILKAEKFFRYYDTLEDDKVKIAAMYLKGDVLDLFSWVNVECTLLYWDELVKN
ncbi:hypothetical protein QN277_001007 [Acacia crassicarpa]|uniref:Uncharacterized protein n=1 Tax=Acacia crassicarpa TaxID=499986 RepID=A0AAE1THU1_9FABA|nr:hypothetical protein QN277_001007 [Acacia crassicarpa]